jgi:hypothetical protein
VRQQRIAGYNDISSGDDRADEQARQSFEEIVQFAAILAIKDREPGERRAPMPVE